MTSAEPDTLAKAIRNIHDHLEATAELPVDPTASTHLGEAEAVAADAVAAARDGQEAVAINRIEQVYDLLSSIDTTGNPVADDHVDEALRLAELVQEARYGSEN